MGWLNRVYKRLYTTKLNYKGWDKMSNNLLTKFEKNFGLKLNEEGEIVVGSTTVAEKYGKEHKNVLSKIDKFVEVVPELGQLNFKPSSYTNLQSKEQREYIMNRQGFSILVNKFTGNKALKFTVKYTQAFEEMAKEIKRLQQDNKQLESDKEELHKIALSNKEQKDRKYQADKVLYGWKSIRSLLENCTYKNIEDVVENIIDFHVNILKKNDRAYNYKRMDKTEYKQAIRDRVFNILEDIYNTTLNGTLRSVVGEIRVNNRQNVIETKNRSNAHKINDLENKLEKVCPTRS